MDVSAPSRVQQVLPVPALEPAALPHEELPKAQPVATAIAARCCPVLPAWLWLIRRDTEGPESISAYFPGVILNQDGRMGWSWAAPSALTNLSPQAEAVVVTQGVGCAWSGRKQKMGEPRLRRSRSCAAGESPGATDLLAVRAAAARSAGRAAVGLPAGRTGGTGCGGHGAQLEAACGPAPCRGCSVPSVPDSAPGRCSGRVPWVHIPVKGSTLAMPAPFPIPACSLPLPW